MHVMRVLKDEPVASPGILNELLSTPLDVLNPCSGEYSDEATQRGSNGSIKR